MSEETPSPLAPLKLEHSIPLTDIPGAPSLALCIGVERAAEIGRAAFKKEFLGWPGAPKDVAAREGWRAAVRAVVEMAHVEHTPVSRSAVVQAVGLYEAFGGPDGERDWSKANDGVQAVWIAATAALTKSGAKSDARLRLDLEDAVGFVESLLASSVYSGRLRRLAVSATVAALGASNGITKTSGDSLTDEASR